MKVVNRNLCFAMAVIFLLVFSAPNVNAQGILDNTWYKANMKGELNDGYLIDLNGNLVKVEPEIKIFFKVCDDEIASDCNGTNYFAVLAIADFDRDGDFEPDEVFSINLETCGTDETSFVTELVVTEAFDVDDDPVTVEDFNQVANGVVKRSDKLENNVLISKGCYWSSDNADTDLTPDITGRKCSLLAKPISIDDLPFTMQDLVDTGVIDEIGDLACGSDDVVADAGDKQEVETGATVTLDGSASFPVDGTYAWEFVKTPKLSKATLSGADTANPTFTADRKGTYEVKLTYTVGQFSSTDSVKVEAEKPTVKARAGKDGTVETGATVTLDGSASTPEGGAFVWKLKSTPEDSTATLKGAFTANPTFTADKAGKYKVKLKYIYQKITDDSTVVIKAEN